MVITKSRLVHGLGFEVQVLWLRTRLRGLGFESKGLGFRWELQDPRGPNPLSNLYGRLGLGTSRESREVLVLYTLLCLHRGFVRPTLGLQGYVIIS